MVTLLKNKTGTKYFMNCTELCIKSNFSFLKSGSHPEEYAARAVNLGLESFAITDENSVSGIVRAHSELKRIMRNSNANSVLKISKSCKWCF